MNLDSFAISAEFRIDQRPPVQRYLLPIIVGGIDEQWITAHIDYDGHIVLTYTGDYELPSTMSIPLGEWNQLILTYDAATQTGRLYLNGALAMR